MGAVRSEGRLEHYGTRLFIVFAFVVLADRRANQRTSDARISLFVRAVSLAAGAIPLRAGGTPIIVEIHDA
jgi:hypothetical protein